MAQKLEEFEKKLYKPDEDKRDRQRTYETLEEDGMPTLKRGWERGEQRFVRRGAGRRMFVVLLVGVLLAGAGAAGYFAYQGISSAFDIRKVEVTIDGPMSVSSGDEVSFTVTYRNNAALALRDANIVFSWPERSIPSQTEGNGGMVSGLSVTTNFGVILPHQEKMAVFKGRIYGSKGEGKDVKVSYRYTPEQSSSVYENATALHVNIAATPFALLLKVPGQVVAGKDVDVILEYQNQSDAAFEDVTVRMLYPADFHVVSADPQATQDNNLWRLGTVLGRAHGVLTIRGNFTGAEGEGKSMRAEIGSFIKEDQFLEYATAEGAVTIASSALLVFQTVNDSRDYSANPGNGLTYKIRYKNTTNVQIPNVAIIARIDPTFIDIKSLNVQWGSFDGRINSLVWNAVGVHDLAVLDPKEEGEVSFSVNLKPVFLPKSFADKNLKVVSTAKITSSYISDQLAGLPLESEDTVEVKINTQFAFYEKGYVKDGFLQSTGPIPPRAGERTTFAISWQLTNTTNDVEGVEVSAVMPPNVEWVGATNPADAAITYDQNSGTITWRPDKVLAGTGILTPVARVDFQVAFTPALVHVGQHINLISGAVLKGSDSFTGLKIERSVLPVNTDLLGALREEGKVVQ